MVFAEAQSERALESCRECLWHRNARRARLLPRNGSTWLELKVKHGNFLDFTPYQIPWMQKRIAQYGNVHVVYFRPENKTICIMAPHILVEMIDEWKRVGKKVRVDVRKLDAIHEQHTVYFPKPYNWKRINGFIF